MFALTRSPIDADTVRGAVEGPGRGAVVVFLGTVRDATDGRAVTHLEYEAFEPLAVRRMAEIARELCTKGGVEAIACVHRLGTLRPGETAMALGVASPHRRAALEGVEAFVARLKQDVPIWKKEHFEDGAVWVGTPDDPQGVRARERTR